MLIGGALSAAAVAVLLVVWPWGPSYQGKSIKTWFYAGGNFRSPQEPELERQAFAAMGDRAVPFLIRRLEDAPSERTDLFLSNVEHHAFALKPLAKGASLTYRQRKEMWQGRAAYLLGEIGPAARSAEPILGKWVAKGNWALRGEATVALMKIRQQPPDGLIEKLYDTNDEAWGENVFMVEQFGSRAEPAIPSLLDALQHTNNANQGTALGALGMIARQPDRCIPAIVPFLSSTDAGHRQKAMGALRSFGTNALSARAVIKSALADPDLIVRVNAELAMRKLGPMAGSDDGTKKTEVSPANAASPHR